MSDFDRLAPGQLLNGIPHRAWNSFLDAAEFVRSQREQTRATALGFGTAPTFVSVKNTTANPLPRFGVVVPNGIAVSAATDLAQFQTEPCLTVTTAGATDLERFLITQQPLAVGACGRAAILGVTACQLDVVDVTDDFADILPGEMSRLRTQPYGPASILYKEPGTGTKWGLVALGGPGMQLVLGKTAGPHAKGTTGVIHVYRGTSAGAESHSGGLTLDAWNHFAPLEADRWVIAAWIQRVWRLISGEC